MYCDAGTELAAETARNEGGDLRILLWRRIG